MRSVNYEDGFSLVEILVAVALGATIAMALLFGTANFGRSLRQSAAVQAAATAGGAVVDSLERDGRSSIAIFRPPDDVANNSNIDGHEVDFYTRDARGAASFTAYCYKATAAACGSSQQFSSVALYRYSWSALPQHGGSGATLSGAVAQNVQSFSATTLTASALLDPSHNPASAPYFARIGITHANDVARQTGYPGVIAGNAVTIVELTTTAGARAVHLLAGALPTRRQIIVASYTPAPNTMTVSAPGGGSSVFFPNPLAPAQSVTISESNYGTRTTAPAQVYRVIGTSCTGTATASPAAIIPAADGTGAGTLIFQPVVKPQPDPVTCSVVVSDNSAQTQTIAVSIGQTYGPTASPPMAGRVGQTGVFELTEQNYPTTPFAVAVSGACANATAVSSTQSNGSYVEQILVQYVASGVCSLSATDAYGQVATASSSVYDSALYALAITSGPTPSTLAPAQTAIFSAAATQTDSQVAPGTPATVPVVVRGSAGPCTAAPTGPTQFSVTASAVGTCTVTLAADVSGVAGATTGNSPLTITVPVQDSALRPGTASATGATMSTLALDSTPPTGGSGSGYAVTYVLSGTPVCNSVVFGCTVSGLAAATTYTFTPVYQDGAGTTVSGAAFSGSTLSAPAPSPTPGLPPTPSPTPGGGSAVVAIAYYDGIYRNATTATCSSGVPTKIETTISHVEIIGAVLAAAPPMTVPADASVSATFSTGCFATATQTVYRIQAATTPFSPQSGSPSPAELSQRLTDDLQIYCTANPSDCPFQYLAFAPGTLADPSQASDLAAAFEKMAAKYSATPSPDGLIYATRYAASSTNGSMWTI